ncbi:uncharacterized protein LOC9638252 [Selaginella moellendorffii]|uniref:uncharacterized protein LOC9638252 n=1 Tax=Selaginella moellendorffii TaxID=88036 RepID=UPI000D1CFA7E|nr:uncharacterized protein LOC9638252 [Selaginella moellendorffii]|eukprot:XP_024533906.1 uncharacterized protein LOC9638252 [Selaginella moellendorffii]
MGACFGKKDCEATAACVVPVSCHPYRFGNGVVLRLFGVELCPFTARIRIALLHKGLSVDPIWVPPEGLQSSKKLEWLESACPDGDVPILQHGGSVIYGSADDIVDYIEATFRDPPLLLEGSAGMDVRDWVEFVRDEFSPLVGQLLYDADPAVQQEGSAKIDTAFARLDRGLWEHGKDGPYFFGQEFSMVDVYLIPFLELVRPLGLFRGVEIRAVHSNLLGYYKRMPFFPSYAPVRMDPDLLEMSVSKAIDERTCPAVASLCLLQHRSILFHIERVVKISEELAATKVNSSTISPVKAGLAMKIKKLSSEYSRLVELMQEHAQMEERTMFPVLENADKGLTELVHADHARDLPIMNGIREDLKSVLALQQGSCVHNEALVALATRLKVFQESTRDHFDEEERDILPLLETVGFGSKQQDAAIESCVIIMEAAHGRLLPYLLQGMPAHEMYQYLRIVQKPFQDPASPSSHVLESMFRSLRNADDEYESVWKLVKERMPGVCKLEGDEKKIVSEKRISTSSNLEVHFAAAA